jgi:hypothetical protein
MLKLKVSRRDAPRRVPFSIIYLYLEDDREAIRAAFPALFEFRPYQLRLAKWAEVRVHSQRPGGAGVTHAEDDKKADTLKSIVPSLFESDSPWYLAVPTILKSGWPRKSRGSADEARSDYMNLPDPKGEATAGSPAYFGHRHAGNWKRQKEGPPVPAPHIVLDPILAIQGEPDRGVCSTCPRYAHNAAGQCFFGDPVCSKHVHSLGASTFLMHLAAHFKTTGEKDVVPGREPRLPGDPNGVT